MVETSAGLREVVVVVVGAVMENSERCSSYVCMYKYTHVSLILHLKLSENEPAPAWNTDSEPKTSNIRYKDKECQSSYGYIHPP